MIDTDFNVKTIDLEGENKIDEAINIKTLVDKS